MEGKFLITEPVHLLDDQCAQHRFGTHATPTGVGLLDVPHQIGVDQVGDTRIGVQDVADNLKFSGVFVTDKRLDKRQLMV